MQALATEFIDINNQIIAVGHQLGLKMWTHNCRGNYDSRNMGGGSYVRIANLFLKQLNYDRFFLEWDDERAGSIEALTVFKDKPNVEIVLGLLSSKTNTLDDEERIVKMLDEASTRIDYSFHINVALLLVMAEMSLQKPSNGQRFNKDKSSLKRIGNKQSI